MKTLPKIHCIRLSIYVYWCQCPFSESCFPFLPNWISPSDMERAQEFKMRPRRYVYDATCLPNTIFGILPLIFQSARLLDNFVAFKFALTYFGRHRALAIYIYIYICLYIERKRNPRNTSQDLLISKVSWGNRIKNSSLLNLCLLLVEQSSNPCPTFLTASHRWFGLVSWPKCHPSLPSFRCCFFLLLFFIVLLAENLFYLYVFIVATSNLMCIAFKLIFELLLGGFNAAFTIFLLPFYLLGPRTWLDIALVGQWAQSGSTLLN